MAGRTDNLPPWWFAVAVLLVLVAYAAALGWVLGCGIVWLAEVIR